MDSPWLGTTPLLLASTSRTRRLLLEGAGLPVETAASDVDERALEARSSDLAPADLAGRLARAKAEAVAMRHPHRVVVGADQVLELDGRVFHKPASAEEARIQLERLSGATHVLHAAVAFAGALNAETVHATARLTVRALERRAIDTYVSCAGEARVCTSVGGYQVEGLGIHLFERIVGEHSTILGLPLLPVLATLRSAGLLAF